MFLIPFSHLTNYYINNDLQWIICNRTFDVKYSANGRQNKKNIKIIITIIIILIIIIIINLCCIKEGVLVRLGKTQYLTTSFAWMLCQGRRNYGRVVCDVG